MVDRTLTMFSFPRIFWLALLLCSLLTWGLVLSSSPASAASTGVLAWGENFWGQLGDGTNTGPENCDGDVYYGDAHGSFLPCSAVPVAVSGIKEAKSVAAGTSHGLALLNDGTVLAWGTNELGQLGDGNTTGPETCKREPGGLPCSTIPVTVSGLSEVVSIAAGGASSFALQRNGTVMTWGGWGQNGVVDVPVPVCTVAEERPCSPNHYLSEVTAIAAGGYYALALLKDGAVMAWGTNEFGQLGDGTSTNSAVPVVVRGLSEVVSIAAGGENSLALLKDGTVMAWGPNGSGQLGRGIATGPETCFYGVGEPQSCSRTPVAVSGLNEVTAIAAGGWPHSQGGHSLALLKNGTVMAWGNNYLGRLGDGKTWAEQDNSDVPVAVSGLSDVTAVSAGGNSFALLTNGTVMAWGGENDRGELGDGITTESDVPIAVDGLSETTAITAGEGNFSLAVGTVTLLPTTTGLAPGYGPVSGGTSVTIAGAGFIGATAVKFGADNAESFTVNSDTSITAVSPPGQEIVPVTVTTAAGTSSTLIASFSYAPVATKLEPDDGVDGGGTSVTIAGANFTGATAVKFGPNDSESFTVNSDGSITAVSPAGKHLEGPVVDVTVIGPGGESATSPADKFGYGPVVDRVQPGNGPAAGGTSVTIAGFALSGATAVDFGSTPAASFTVNANGSITAVSPAFTNGSASVPVTVTTPTGVSGTCDCSKLPASYFRYAPTVTSVEPDEGPLSGGTKVTIHGTGFYGTGEEGFPFVLRVEFGGASLDCGSIFPSTEGEWYLGHPCGSARFIVDSETEITAISPGWKEGSVEDEDGLTGPVDVTVHTAGGVSPTTAADQFRYPGPVIENESATGVTEHNATLEAHINPENAETSYEFWLEFLGSPPVCSECAPLSTERVGSGRIPSGDSAQTVTAVLSHLQPGEYLYWVVAINPQAEIKGEEKHFYVADTGIQGAEETPSTGGGGQSGVSNDDPFSPMLTSTPSGTVGNTIAPKALTTAQKLAKALKRCEKDRSRTKRGTCEKQALRKYAATADKAMKHKHHRTAATGKRRRTRHA